MTLRPRSTVVGLFGDRKPFVAGRLAAYRMLRHADLTRSVHSSPLVSPPVSLSLAGGADAASLLSRSLAGGADAASEPSSSGVPASASPEGVGA